MPVMQTRRRTCSAFIALTSASVAVDIVPRVSVNDQKVDVSAAAPLSDPALNGGRGVLWNSVEADLCVRRFLVDHVHELFEQREHRRNGSDARADEDAVKCLLLERG